jgi:hypothetical protein
MSPIDATPRTRMCTGLLVTPLLTKCRPVDFCRVAASLCR